MWYNEKSSSIGGESEINEKYYEKNYGTIRKKAITFHGEKERQ